MARNPIRKDDYLFAWGGAAVSGIVAVMVLALAGELSAVYALGGVLLIAVLAALAVPATRASTSQADR